MPVMHLTLPHFIFHPVFTPINFVAHIPAIHHATCKHLLTMFHHDVIINIMVDIEHMPSSTLHYIMRVYGFPESGFLSSSDSNSDNIFNDSSDDEDVVLKTGKWLHESITHILWLILVSRTTTNPSHLITQMTGYIRRSTWMTSPYDTPNTWTGLHSFGDIYKSNHYQLFLWPSVCEQAYVESCDRFSTFRTSFWTPLHKIDNWQNYYQMRMGLTYKESLTEATCLWLYSTSHNYFAWISGKQKTLPLRPNCLQRSIEFFQDVFKNDECLQEWVDQIPCHRKIYFLWWSIKHNSYLVLLVLLMFFTWNYHDVLQVIWIVPVEKNDSLLLHLNEWSISCSVWSKEQQT